MKNILGKPFLVTILFLFCQVLVLEPVWAEQIDFDSVLNQAIQNAYDLKLSQIDVGISQAGVKEKRADFYPSLQVRTFSEHLGDLQSNPSGLPVVIGQTILPSGTRFQHSVSLNATYTVFDFGARSKQLDMAKKDVNAKEATLAVELRDLKLKMIDLYTDALTTYEQIHFKECVVPIDQALFEISKRLYNAGKGSKVTIAENAINLAQTMSDLDDLKHHFNENLASLGLFTHQEYNPNAVDVAGYRDEPVFKLKVLDETSLPEYQQYAYQIVQKQDELSSLKRQLLPVVSLYGNYNLYGFNPSNVASAVHNVSPDETTVGFSISMTLFDGFKNAAQQERAQLEIQHLQTERQQKIAQIRNTYQKSQHAYENSFPELEHRQDTINQTQNKLDLVMRLSEQALIDRLEILHTQRDMFDHQLSSELTRIKRIADMKKLKVITEG